MLFRVVQSLSVSAVRSSHERCRVLEPRARECARTSLTMERHRLPSQPELTAAARVVDGAQQRQYCCYGRAWVGAATVVRAPRVGAATVVRAPTEHPPGSSLGEHERLASPPASLGPRATAPRAPPYAWPYHNSPVRQLHLRNKAATPPSGEPPSPPVPNVRPARGALGTDGGVRGALKLTRTPPARSRSLPPSPHPGAAMAAAKRSTEITISELTISLSTLESPIESPHALSTPRRVRRVSFGELCLEQRRAMGLTVASGARQMAPDDGEMTSRRECRHHSPHALSAAELRSPSPASPLPRRPRASLAEPIVSPHPMLMAAAVPQLSPPPQPPPATTSPAAPPQAAAATASSVALPQAAAPRALPTPSKKHYSRPPMPLGGDPAAQAHRPPG